MPIVGGVTQGRILESFTDDAGNMRYIIDIGKGKTVNFPEINLRLLRKGPTAADVVRKAEQQVTGARARQREMEIVENLERTTEKIQLEMLGERSGLKLPKLRRKQND